MPEVKLMTPLFDGGMYNRTGRRMRAVFIKEVADGTTTYRLWRKDGKPEIEYPRCDNDRYRWPLIRELLNRYCGYKLADDDLLLLSIGGTLYFIADIGLRMLSPRELYNAMGFPPDYIIDRDYTGKPYPKNEQVARCGNAVCPPLAAAVARANFPEYVAGDTIGTMAALMDRLAV